MRKLFFFFIATVFFIYADIVCAKTFSYNNFFIDIESPQGFIDTKILGKDVEQSFFKTFPKTNICISAYVPENEVDFYINGGKYFKNFIVLTTIKEVSKHILNKEDFIYIIPYVDKLFMNDSELLKIKKSTEEELNKKINAGVLIESPQFIEKIQSKEYVSYCLVLGYKFRPYDININMIAVVSCVYVNKNVLTIYSYSIIDKNMKKSLSKAKMNNEKFIDMVLSLNN